MRFNRYEVRKGPREWTPRKIAAASRVARKEMEAVALFPDLARIKTTEDRMNEVNRQHDGFTRKHRDWQASAWRAARKALADLPDVTRRGVIRYWRLAIVPASPSYMLGIIREARTVSPWTKLREIHCLKAAGIKWRAAHGWK